MKQALKFLALVVTALFLVGFVGGFAFAQDAEAAGLDLGAWFVDTAALAAVVATVVAFLRQHVLKALDGFAVVIVSLGVGAGLGVFGSLAGYVDGGVLNGLVFGVSAGFVASGGVDMFRSILGKRQAAPLPAE